MYLVCISIQSSRRLERQTQRNLELIWLTGRATGVPTWREVRPPQDLRAWRPLVTQRIGRDQRKAQQRCSNAVLHGYFAQFVEPSLGLRLLGSRSRRERPDLLAPVTGMGAQFPYAVERHFTEIRASYRQSSTC